MAVILLIIFKVTTLILKNLKTKKGVIVVSKQPYMLKLNMAVMLLIILR